MNNLDKPLYLRGPVIKGFGRGSKELGIPTANLPIEAYEKELPNIKVGVYWGFARLKNSEIYPMAMSIGWNPFYKNDKKTIEIHIIHQFEKDFYGEELSAIALGYIRPERDFKSLQELIDEINEDIKKSVQYCGMSEWTVYKEDPWLKE